MYVLYAKNCFIKQLNFDNMTCTMYIIPVFVTSLNVSGIKL